MSPLLHCAAPNQAGPLPRGEAVCDRLLSIAWTGPGVHHGPGAADWAERNSHLIGYLVPALAEKLMINMMTSQAETRARADMVSKKVDDLMYIR